MELEDVVVLYINKYKPRYPLPAGVPRLKENEIYRAIRRIEGEDETYKVVVSPKGGGFGVILSDGLEHSDPVDYKATIVDKGSIKNLHLTDGQMDKIIDWGTSKNEDILHLKGEEAEKDSVYIDVHEDGSVTSPNTEVPKNISKEINPEEFFLQFMDYLDETQGKSKPGSISDFLDVIDCEDPDLGLVLANLIEYLGTTYTDKYADGSNEIDTKAFLYGKNGKSINIFQAAKYMGRYNTEGYEKSENPVDLMKAIHYLLFELVRQEINKSS